MGFDVIVCVADSRDCFRCFQLCAGGSVTDLVKSRIKDGGGHLPELILAYVIKETLNVSIKDLSINVIVKTAEQQRYTRTVSQSRFVAQN